jgi:hypothetical protein
MYCIVLDIEKKEKLFPYINKDQKSIEDNENVNKYIISENV